MLFQTSTNSPNLLYVFMNSMLYLQTDNETNLIIFNSSVNATITLWGKHIKQFNPNIYKEEDSPHIIIVTSTTVNI